MFTITSIKPQKKKERYNIYIDGKFAFGLDEINLAKYRLKVGDELTEVDLRRFKEEGELGKLFDKTLRFLTFRPRSEREIRLYLKRKLLSRSPSSARLGEKSREKKIGQIIERLKKLGYIDDSAFAVWWFQQRRRQLKGMKLIRLELWKKGVSKEIIEDVIASVSNDSETDYNLALEAAKKKLAVYKKLETQKFRQKMGMYLARRGFSWETIKRVIQEIS